MYWSIVVKLSILSILCRAQPPSALDGILIIYENSMSQNYRETLLATCRNTEACCYGLHSNWATEARTTFPSSQRPIESHAPSEPYHEDNLVKLSFSCYDTRLFDHGRMIPDRRTGPFVMTCPETDVVLWRIKKNSYNGTPRRAGFCRPPSSTRHKVVAGTSECVNLENLTFTAQEADA